MVTKVTGMMQTGTKGGDIPSASTLVIDTDGDYFDITGTTGITAMTVDAGRRFTLHFDGALTLTHGSSLYLPGAVNFTTEANDCLSFIATAANTVRCTGYALKDGGSPVAPVVADNSITLAKMAGGTDGQILSYDANGDPIALGPGTDGQVLTSTGAGSPPAFEALPGGGKVLQVVSTTKTDTFTTTNSAFTDVTGLTISITPASASNKVFVIASVVMGCTAGSEKTSWRLMRDSTAIHIGDAASSRTRQTVQWQSTHATSMIMNTCNILDSPSSTSAVAYHIEGMAQDTSGSMCVNRSGTWGTGQEYGTYASTVTAMEIGA